MTLVGPGGRAEARRLALMAVVALLLGTVVASSLAEGPDAGVADPRASFTFETDNRSVLVTHYGGDELDPARVYVVSATRGRLGNFEGSDGVACVRNLTQVVPGTTCRVPDSRFDRLYVVWESGDGRRLILARRDGDPTPTPTATASPTATGTPPGTAAPTPGTATATPGGRTTTTVAVTATATGPTATATPGGTTTTAAGNGTTTPTAGGTPAASGG